MFTLPGGLTITATLIKFEINTSTVAVDSLSVPAGPFLRVRVENAKLTLGTGGPTLQGSFLFDQSTRGGFTTDDDVRAERRRPRRSPPATSTATATSTSSPARAPPTACCSTTAAAPSPPRPPA